MNNIVIRIRTGLGLKRVGEFSVSEIPRVGEKVTLPEQDKYGSAYYEVVDIIHTMPDIKRFDNDSVIDVIIT